MAMLLLGEGAAQDVCDACAGLGELLWDGVQSLLHVVIVQRHLLSAAICQLRTRSQAAWRGQTRSNSRTCLSAAEPVHKLLGNLTLVSGRECSLTKSVAH